MSEFRIRPLTGALGAEIDGIDLRKPLDRETAAAIRQALLDHLAIFFRDQPLSPEELLAFGRSIGPIHVHPFAPSHPDHEEIVKLDLVNPRGQGADRWHTDATFMEEPPLGAVLQAVELPPVGGDTLFASMYAAYEALSPSVRALLDGLHAEHDLTARLVAAVEYGHSDADVDAMQRGWPPRAHPVVRTHPETGRKILFVNSNFTTRIEGLTEAESDHLLAFLLDHLRSPDFQCRFHWEPHSIAVWDNRCTQHYAVPDYTERRVMHRLNLDGDAPY